jgi:hypothetical protein
MALRSLKPTKDKSSHIMPERLAQVDQRRQSSPFAIQDGDKSAVRAGTAPSSQNQSNYSRKIVDRRVNESDARSHPVKLVLSIDG